MSLMLLLVILEHVAIGLAAFGLARWLYLRARAVRSRALRFAVTGFVLLGAGGIAMAVAELAFAAGLDGGIAGRLYKAGWQVSGVWFAYFMVRFAFRYFHLSVPYRALLYGTLATIAFTALYEAAGWALVEGEDGIPLLEASRLGTGLMVAQSAAWVLIFTGLAVSFFVSSHREAIPRRRAAKAYTGAAFALVPPTVLWGPFLLGPDGAGYVALALFGHVLLWEVLAAVGLWWVFVGPSLAAHPRGTRVGAGSTAPQDRAPLS